MIRMFKFISFEILSDIDVLNYVFSSDNQEIGYFNLISDYPDLKNVVEDKFNYMTNN